MIYERVNWLNKGETGAKPINKTNLNQMDKGIYDLQNIELIGVEKTAPTECTTGDKYFNTTDKKIYTATADNTWGETGETPLRGILYVIISSQTSYYYDGDTLISIGGGNGGTTIPVSSTPPEDPEDGALWVDTDDEGVIVEVDQEVNSGSTNAVSNKAITNYVNDLNTYSTTETIVGYDDSQKAIYRKVFKGQLASMAIIAENVENYYGCYGCVEMDSNTYPSLPYYEYSTSGAYLSTIQYISSNNTIRFVAQKAGANVTVNVNFYIEYTKTTDVTTSKEV